MGRGDAGEDAEGGQQFAVEDRDEVVDGVGARQDEGLECESEE